MKRNLVGLGVMWGLFFQAVSAGAYPETHPPFPFKAPRPYPMLMAQQVLLDYSSGPARVQEGELEFVAIPAKDDHSSTIQVIRNGVTIFNLTDAYQGFFFPFGSRVFYTDLTGDGRNDVLIYSYPGGNGLGASVEMADVLIAQPDGSFRHAQFEAYAAGPEDFIDVNGDGRYEMLWVSYYFEGRHSYWVYRVVEITDEGLRLNDPLVPGFPKIIWFSEKPNDRLAARLTQAERDDLIHQSTVNWQRTPTDAQIYEVIQPIIMEFSHGGGRGCVVSRYDLNGDGQDEAVYTHPAGMHGSRAYAVRWEGGKPQVLFDESSNTPNTAFISVEGVPAILIEESDYEPSYVEGARIQQLYLWDGTTFTRAANQDCRLKNQVTWEDGQESIGHSDAHCLPKREPMPSRGCLDLKPSSSPP